MITKKLVVETHSPNHIEAYYTAYELENGLIAMDEKLLVMSFYESREDIEPLNGSSVLRITEIAKVWWDPRDLAKKIYKSQRYWLRQNAPMDLPQKWEDFLNEYGI